MGVFVSLGSALIDAFITRGGSVLPAVPIVYRGEQGSNSDYIVVEDEDERYSPEWSDKDFSANDYVLVLEFWGLNPRTISGYAKILIDSVNQTPLAVTGFYHLRTKVERNNGRPAFTIEGQANQYSRQLQIRFFYHPNIP